MSLDEHAPRPVLAGDSLEGLAQVHELPVDAGRARYLHRLVDEGLRAGTLSPTWQAVIGAAIGPNADGDPGRLAAISTVLEGARRAALFTPSTLPPDALDRLDAIGAMDAGRGPEAVLEELGPVLEELETAASTPPSPAELLAEIERLRGRVRADGPDALPALRRALDVARRALGLLEPARVVPPAYLCAFDGAASVQHVATGLSTLDRFTRGGLMAERLVMIAGEPNVGKTALAVQIGTHAAAQGYAVAIHVADVDRRADVATRIGVARGVALEQLEAHEPHAIARTLEILRETPTLRIVDQRKDRLTVEDTADMLLDAKRRDPSLPGLVLIVDSIQTAIVRGLQGERAPRIDKERIDITVRALQEAADRGILVIATSEVPRGVYNAKKMDSVSDMAAFKGSGSIEFAMWTGIVLRKLRDEPHALRAGIPKNKRGDDGVAFKLLRDPRRATFTDAGALEADASTGDGEPVKPRERPTTPSQDIALAREVLRKNPGIQGKEALKAAIVDAAKARKPPLKIGTARAWSAIVALEQGGEIEDRGKKKPARPRLFWHDPGTPADTADDVE